MLPAMLAWLSRDIDWDTHGSNANIIIYGILEKYMSHTDSIIIVFKCNFEGKKS